MDLKGEKSAELSFEKFIKLKTKKKTYGFSILIFIILLAGGVWVYLFNEGKIFACGDGTLSEECSLRKPNFCLNGILVENATLCGCPEKTTEKEGYCYSNYQEDSKKVQLEYILDGKKEEIYFTVYNGMKEYLSNLPRTITYSENETPSREDFKLRNVNDEEQRVLLLPLVTKIQNLAQDKDDQARIAISLVQNIPFGQSDQTTSFFYNSTIDYSRYPYEVLYDKEGVCGEKTELLAFILRELGYGVVFFYYPNENHESLGIKCLKKYSVNNSGYCFIETTGPSIISDSGIEYDRIRHLISEPKIIFVSDGESLGENFEEYRDAIELMKLRKSSEENGGLNIFEMRSFQKLENKYKLVSVYDI